MNPMFAAARAAIFLGTGLTSLFPAVSQQTTALAGVMDQYHRTYDVYTDALAAGNNFNARALMGSAPVMVENHTGTPHSGSTCIKATYDPRFAPFWGGWYFMNGTVAGSATSPTENWGTVPNAGINLTGATRLTFWARGEEGGERVQFFCLGVGRDSDTGVPNAPYPDSARQARTNFVTLSRTWTQYTISLQGMNLNYVLGGFGWTTSAPDTNDHSISFYLDDIQFDLARLNAPRFLASYQTRGQATAFDTTMTNAALTQDNALALLAFIAVGDNARAGRIADALAYAQANDRTYADGRLRNAYQAGELAAPPGWEPNGRKATVRLPGWLGPEGSWHEDEFAVGSGASSIAWAMIALLAHDRAANRNTYLTIAIKMGDWVETNLRDTRGAGGYVSGFTGPEPTPTLMRAKSTADNATLYAAYTRLYRVTGDAKWTVRATHARNFVLAMWDATGRLFWGGTDVDGTTINRTTLPLSAQTFPLLALTDVANTYSPALAFAEQNHRIASTGGFDFDTDRDGTWFEGTAQIAAASTLTNQDAKATAALTALQRGVTASGALLAASIDGLTTGFETSPGTKWVYYQREHIAATAWSIFAESKINPFWLAAPSDPLPPGWVAASFGDTQFANLSSRGLTRGGAGAMFGGFVISGPEAARKNTLLRGVGPTLRTFGITGSLSKPVLTLYAGNGAVIRKVRSQDLSGTGAIDPRIQQAGRSVGAFELVYQGPTFGDVALLIDLAPGAYTVDISPDSDAPPTQPNATTGIVLLEIYDAGTNDGSRFSNLATRAPIGTGADQLIVGFVIKGSAESRSRTLVRGVGPGLAPFGVTGALLDPSLTLFEASRSISVNDNWGDNANADQFPVVARSTGAFALAAGSKDAAVLTLLTPGSYSAIIEPRPAEAGLIGLAEIYEAP